MELDLSSYGTKTNLKNVTYVDVSSFALKKNLANLKTEVDKIDTAKLSPVPDDLAKLSNVVKSDVVKKTEYDKLVAKVDNIDTTRFVLKTKYQIDKSDLEKKIIDADKKFLKKADYNAKISEIESKIPGISSLAKTSAFTVNKTRNVSNLVKKTDYNIKISETEKVSDHNHDKYITTPEFNNLAAGVFAAKFAQAD